MVGHDRRVLEMPTKCPSSHSGIATLDRALDERRAAHARVGRLLYKLHDFAASGKITDNKTVFTRAFVISKHFLVEILCGFRSFRTNIVGTSLPSETLEYYLSGRNKRKFTIA